MRAFVIISLTLLVSTCRSATALRLPALAACLGTRAAAEAGGRTANFTAHAATGAPANLLPAGGWASAKTPAQEVLTLAAAFTAERLAMLEGMCTSWNGRLAASLYLPLLAHQSALSHQAQIAGLSSRLQQLVARLDNAPNACSLDCQLVTELVHVDMLAQAPVNSLRNVALLLARTPLVAVLDADFLPSRSLVDDVADAERASRLMQLARGRTTAVILPAFEMMPLIGAGAAAEAGDSSYEATMRARDADKATLKTMLEQRQLRVFANNTRSHRATDSDKWLGFEGDSYSITPEPAEYEPWIILDSALALQHPYDEAFRGYGYNRVSHIRQLRARGWQFSVHGRGFIVHRSHPASAAKLSWRAARRNPHNLRSMRRVWRTTKSGTYKPILAACTVACLQQATAAVGAQ